MSEYIIKKHAGDNIEELVKQANGKATKRLLAPEWAKEKALEIYSLWVDRCSALGVPFSAIRVEITGGEKLALSYENAAYMTSLVFDGKEWSANRVYNKPPGAYGYGRLHIEGGATEAKAYKAKAEELGLSVRKSADNLFIYKGSK